MKTTKKIIKIEPEQKTKLKVAAYCRVSTDKAEQQKSLDIQIKIVSSSYCSNSYMDYQIIRTFI